MYALGNQGPCILQMNFSLDREKKLPHVEQPITVAEPQDLLNRIVDEMTLSPFVKSPLELVRADQLLDPGKDAQAAAAPGQLPGQSKYWFIQVPLEKVDHIEAGALCIC